MNEKIQSGSAVGGCESGGEEVVCEEKGDWRHKTNKAVGVENRIRSFHKFLLRKSTCTLALAMSAAQQQINQPASSTWTEPPWSGWIETTGDALLILEAARRGLIPRVTRRLVDAERKMITSGSVFVFDEDESGIKRWTDGFFWSPSRILGNFLLYRETDKRGGHRGARVDPQPSDINPEAQYNVDGVKLEGQTLSRPKSDNGQMGVDKHRERTLMGSLTNSYKFKHDGLMKKTFSLTIQGVSQHLISYYKIEDVENGRLRSPSSLPELASLDISPEYLDKTHFRNPPKVEIGVDGMPRYRGEADDIDTSPSLPAESPLSSGPPLHSDIPGNNKRGGKRYDPYSAPKRPRLRGKPSPGESPTSASPLSPQSVSDGHSPLGYPDPNIPSTSAHVPYPPSYSAPGFYQVPHYPMPPPHTMYSPPTYQPGNVPMQQGPPPQQLDPTSSSHYTYSGYATPVTMPGNDGMQHTQPTQQQPTQTYYSYYPPPHATYPGYAGVAWPHYAGYPPQPAPQPQQLMDGGMKTGVDSAGLDNADNGDS